MQVENYHRAFPDMHRELYQLYISDNMVVVQLALQGTHLGPLWLPAGTLPPTGKRMDAPCCDVFELIDGKIKRFDCYPEGSIILTQLGVIDNLGAALVPRVTNHRDPVTTSHLPGGKPRSGPDPITNKEVTCHQLTASSASSETSSPCSERRTGTR